MGYDNPLQNEYEGFRQRAARIEGNWCDDCHGYTHMPWCSEYEESGTVPANATGMSTLEQAQALTRDWNQKSRFEQILIRHQIWGNSALPDDEYTASYYDVKVLIKEHAAQLRFLGNRAEELSSLLAGMTTERDEMREALRQAREQIEFLEQALEEYHGSRQRNPALDVIDAALNHAEQGEGS